MTVGIHRGDGNGRSPFQVSVGVVRLRRWWVDGTRGLHCLSFYPLLRLAKVSNRLSSSGIGGTLQYGAVVARPGLSKMGDVSIDSLI